ncbi:F-box/WD repeat-containing protein 12 [Brachionichthys hirsutus]|uniref:F-box/WD repeat-containing protein 12 n=1 Tax=Brachionichthys hirsutus TaxID=412623 RepID=UPI003604C604
MDLHPQHLIGDCLIHIFTFLPEEDLINASSACKGWHEAAETPWLWRRLCLQHWTFCDLAAFQSVNHSWKKYFLQRSHLERKMTKGRTGGYTCKSLRGHRGKVKGLTYLRENSAQLPHLWGVSATVCSACTGGTVRAWNIQSGELLWCSPEQKPLFGIVSDKRREVVITVEFTGLIKTWNGQTGQELGSFPAAGLLPFTLLQYNVDDNWFLSVADGRGSLCTLADTSLTEKSSVMVGDSAVNILLISPDRRLMVAASTDGHDATAICTESLTSPSEDGEPLRLSMPIGGSSAAVFVPTQPARLAVVNNEDTQEKVLYVFDLGIKRSKSKSEIQVKLMASFPFTLKVVPRQLFLKASGSNRLVLAADQELWVYSLNGALLASFKDHTMSITSLFADSLRVVTASEDLSLRVMTWRKDRDRGMILESRYHLLGGSHTMFRGLTHVACDYSSIVAVAEGIMGNDVLKAYSFRLSAQK